MSDFFFATWGQSGPHAAFLKESDEENETFTKWILAPAGQAQTWPQPQPLQQPQPAQPHPQPQPQPRPRPESSAVAMAVAVAEALNAVTRPWSSGPGPLFFLVVRPLDWVIIY